MIFSQLTFSSLPPTAASLNKHQAEAMLYIVSILRLAESPSLQSPMDDDSKLRMLHCLQILTKPDPEVVQVWLHDCRASFSSLAREKMTKEAAETHRTLSQVGVHLPLVASFCCLQLLTLSLPHFPTLLPHKGRRPH